MFWLVVVSGVVFSLTRIEFPPYKASRLISIDPNRAPIKDNPCQEMFNFFTKKKQEICVIPGL